SFNLKKNGVKYIIHTVGKSYRDGNQVAENILHSCYVTALKIASELNCKSVAIPLLATGHYGFPKDLALQIAVEEISRFLLEHEVDVFLVVYDSESYKISEKLFDDVEDFLSDNLKSTEKKDDRQIAPIDLDAFIRTSKNTLNFQNTLMHHIAVRNLENATVYKKACIDKKFFSKIISNKDYVPKKHAVMALGLALELSLSEYEDFLASAGYSFMPSSRFDMIIKFCVMNHIYNLINVDVLLNDHGEECFAPS
ncbi:MAG: macro domain-containing protein, partial [Treponema sp.]|nr:macro domain-containing protein [Treponema sp.]